MRDDLISVCDLRDAKTYLTKTDHYILLRVRTWNDALPEVWLRLERSDFIGLAAHLTSDAEQLSILQ
ncbi:hypothetical protein [Bradyrhizobium sp. Gha]|uniref:hypothetical protein n=1 Tax=Bradyrhizobium sp. Gha TaxID=1855318 RepID=UPI0008F2F0A5|nr:hypothetical protein [Bradyrhizobium sp. Gha]SFJ25539.1 hypothetical protein SAMN05216525_12142 [Bradyrhizobium sp. Gha]